MLNKSIIFKTLFLLFISAILHSEPLIIDKDLKSVTFGKNIQYFEDIDNIYTIGSISAPDVEWTQSNQDAFNFGFSKSAFWFKFDAENPTEDNIEWFFEIGYPLLDSLILFYQNESGDWTKKVTGDLLNHSNRDIDSTNFVFTQIIKPGIQQYYFKVKTDSSSNFPVLALSPAEYYKIVMEKLPILWMYNGIMFIMIIYNLFIFLSSKDLSYLFYVGFIISLLLLQMTLNGQAFQYLWPNSIWWGNKASPFFTVMTCLTAALFFREYIHTRTIHKKTDKVLLYIIILPATLIIAYTFIGSYRLAMISGTALAMITMVILFTMLTFHAVTGSRPARFAMIAFLGMIIGIGLFTLKTFGVLPSNFLTTWGLQIGSALIVVLLSLGLADKINEMRKGMSNMNSELEKNRDNISERAVYLEDVVKSVNSISGSLLSLSNELSEISIKFSGLSSEQASTSEEMSATFEELTSSNETIHKTTMKQKEEGIKGKEYSAVLLESQQRISKSSLSVIDSLDVISESTNVTEFTLSKMIEKMSVINDGGQSINNFAAMIDDITDRINLLSLNAAIEAARAGDYGRGFSVVSDEIGKLAAATAENSKEISTEIAKIIVDIQEGMNMFKNTKKSIDVTFTMVNEINKNMTEVNTLMKEQEQAITDGAVQSEIIDILSKEVEISTKEQSKSMLETMNQIDRLAEMASEIALLNTKIVEFNKLINQKSVSLNSLVTNLA